MKKGWHKPLLYNTFFVIVIVLFSTSLNYVSPTSPRWLIRISLLLTLLLGLLGIIHVFYVYNRGKKAVKDMPFKEFFHGIFLVFLLHIAVLFFSFNYTSYWYCFFGIIYLISAILVFLVYKKEKSNQDMYINKKIALIPMLDLFAFLIPFQLYLPFFTDILLLKLFLSILHTIVLILFVVWYKKYGLFKKNEVS